MAGIIISPCTDQKIRSRNAALRLKHGLPAFKDVLRQRFRRRIKESRGCLVDKLREVKSPEGVRCALRQEMSNIVGVLDYKSELDMVHAASVPEEMEEDLTDQEAWVMHHYNSLLSEDEVLQQLYEDSTQVICPVCYKGYLTLSGSEDMIQCSSCTMMVPARAPLQEVYSHLLQCVDAHDDSGCAKPLNFFVSNEENTAYLYGVCSLCSFLNLIV